MEGRQHEQQDQPQEHAQKADEGEQKLEDVGLDQKQPSWETYESSGTDDQNGSGNGNGNGNENTNTTSSTVVGAVAMGEPDAETLWSPSGIWYKDFLYFVGPGWFVSIAYIDPGNYQADIQAGATSRYSLLCIIWWTSVLSMYVQILCVRLYHYSGLTLAQAQAKYCRSAKLRYLSWFFAEFSTVITDLPTVIGIGIACNIFFSWPYWVGVILSLLTTMIFLFTLNYGTRYLEGIIVLFVGIMSIALLIEMDFVGVNGKELARGWAIGFADLQRSDIFAITGVVGSVVMPHNLYLHTAACASRKSQRQHVKKAVLYSSLEPILPVLISFVINLAVVSIASERVYGTDNAADVGLTDFCDYFQKLVAGCSLWGIALLAAGQSSAITTTYTGQYVMDGFLNIELPLRQRAILTRLVAITPCVIVSAAFPDRLNQLVNVVNAALSFLLPFAFTPLVKYNCSEGIMGRHNASKGWEKYLLFFFAFCVWFVNALGLSVKGGGFFGDLRSQRYRANDKSFGFVMGTLFLLILELLIQFFYAYWNWRCVQDSSTNQGQLLPDATPSGESFEIPGCSRVIRTGESNASEESERRIV